MRIHRHRALVVGSGIAGLSAALGLGRATVLTDTTPGQGGSSRWAQGGVAAAVGANDSPQQHRADTVAVAGGLAVDAIVELVTERGPDAVAFLEQAGAHFDRHDNGGGLDLGREAGHSQHRIVHAAGDSTGAEIMRALTEAALGAAGIDIIGDVQVLDLALRDGLVVGVVALHRQRRELVVHLAEAVVLATGGYGHAYARTSTPAQVNGAGIAMAARAGAAIADMEFVQFHPTTLDVDADPAPLLTEALRGEGAILVDRHGQRFMVGRHDDAELAPRDVVARAVYQSLQAGDRPALDARNAVGDTFPARFPTVFALATAHGLDPRRHVLPVAPAAHYTMGGVAVDSWGRTSLPGLWAAGEVASSGLHGANRLASNSLLEGVVLGRRVAQSVLGDHERSICSTGKTVDQNEDVAASVAEAIRVRVPSRLANADPGWFDRDDGVDLIRDVLWQRAGVLRDAKGLERGRSEIAEIVKAHSPSAALDTAATVACLVLDAALRRTESRGAHARSDFPELDVDQAQRHSQQPEPVVSVAVAELNLSRQSASLL